MILSHWSFAHRDMPKWLNSSFGSPIREGAGKVFRVPEGELDVV